MKGKQQVIVQAPGKVNLYLEIVGTNDVGYHLLETVMHSIHLEDTVVIEKTEEKQIDLGTSWSHIPAGEGNIAHRAALAFFRWTKIPLEGLFIHIDKVIPDQAGLGGGSSDAAAVLIGLNEMYETKLSVEELCQIGVTIGADVPFCLQGGCALAEGIGEILTPLPVLKDCYFVIVKPMVGVDTAEAFRIYDQWEAETSLSSLSDMLEAFRQEDLHRVGRCMGNVFEQVLKELPSQRIRKQLEDCGAIGVSLSGSGSAMVGLFDNQTKAKDCYRKMSQRMDEVHFTYPVSYGAKIRTLKTP